MGTAPGIAGKVMGLPNGVLIISWRLGDVELDSGFRADDPALQAAWIDAAAALIGSARGADHSGSDHDDSSPVRPDGVRPDGGAPTSSGAPA